MARGAAAKAGAGEKGKGRAWETGNAPQQDFLALDMGGAGAGEAGGGGKSYMQMQMMEGNTVSSVCLT